MTKIEITREHLRDGDANVPNKSAIALAFREKFPKKRLFFYSDGFEDLSEGRRILWDHERDDHKELRLFFITDPRKRKPFGFEIDWPHEERGQGSEDSVQTKQEASGQ